MIQYKKCLKCQEEKEIDKFNFSKNHKDGKSNWCKICMALQAKNYRINNPEKHRESRRKHYNLKKDELNQKRKKHTQKRKNQKREYDKVYRELKKEKIRQYKKDWHEKVKNDPVYKIKRNLRRRVHHVLKGNLKADKTFNLIGCTAQEFKLHIESLWKEGMSWDNYGTTGWHIDHIIPCHKFDLLQEEDQRKCFHYSNQRPLWAWENLTRTYDDIPLHLEPILLPIP